MLVLESYTRDDFTFVKSQILFDTDEPFQYDSNSLTFIRAAQWICNGDILAVNVPNVKIYFFDIQTGKLVGQEKSEHLLMCYSWQRHKFFTIRSMP